jgi:uncharacterized repeat protein (TIGR03803 family)
VGQLSLLGRACVSLSFIVAMPVVSHAQTFTVLVNFNGTNNGDNPVAPLVKGSDGNFYGTTKYGGAFGGAFGGGTVFKVTPGGMLTILHSFSGDDGASPEAPLIQAADGNFYGTTFFGGSGDFCQISYTSCGTVFILTPTGQETVLYKTATQTPRWSKAPMETSTVQRPMARSLSSRQGASS